MQAHLITGSFQLRATVVPDLLHNSTLIDDSHASIFYTNSEAGALPSEVRIDFEDDSDQKSEFLGVFWKPLFSTFHAAMFIISRKDFLQFSEVRI